MDLAGGVAGFFGFFKSFEGFVKIGAVIALGYQGEPAALGNAQMIKQEVSKRERKPLSDFVLSGWGEPAKLG